MRVLLTNDDGIDAAGLQALRRSLLEVPGVELAVIAPDSNRSATARSITIRRPIWVQEVDFGDGTRGYATDGTPVDCVRFATLGLIEGFEAELSLMREEDGRRLFRIYGPAPEDTDEPGTDQHAVARGNIAVTPLGFELT